jgi:F0F1-type ATP synthase assembly protein I
MSADTSRTTGTDAPAAAPSRRGAAAPQRGAVSRAFRRASYANALNKGFADSMSRGIELTLTLVVMVGLGWLADRIFDTAPLFVIVFSVLGFAGTTVKLFLGYDREMKGHEEGAIWNRKSGAAS